jgi:tetratricopeptide (TPR) repeat protein
VRIVLALWLCALSATALADEPSEERIEELRAILDRSPGDADARLRLALALELSARPVEALSELDVFAALHPGDRAADLLRAQVLADLGRDGDAVVILDDRIARGGDIGAYWLRARLRERAGDGQGALEDYDAAIGLGDALELYVARGALLERAARLDEAVLGYEAGLIAHSGAVVLREALARVERRRGRREAAITHLDAIIGAARVAPRWRIERASLLAELGRHEEAQVERRTALAEAERMLVNRASPAALVERARARIALGQHREAIADLELALRRAPQLTEARALLATARSGR